MASVTAGGRIEQGRLKDNVEAGVALRPTLELQRAFRPSAAMLDGKSCWHVALRRGGLRVMVLEVVLRARFCSRPGDWKLRKR